VRIYHTEIDSILMKDPDAFLLLVVLRRIYGDLDFPLPNERRKTLGWTTRRFAGARARLIEDGVLVLVRPPTRNNATICRLAVS
jgi:hypothetical protein